MDAPRKPINMERYARTRIRQSVRNKTANKRYRRGVLARLSTTGYRNGSHPRHEEIGLASVKKKEIYNRATRYRR